MGWTSYFATEWKNGKIDRKAECDKLWTQTESEEFPQLRVLKSSMSGATYYAAVEVSYPTTHKKPTSVIGAVVLTQTDGNEFAYKAMDETVGPNYCDCPTGILDLLTPTESKLANEWRTTCKRHHVAKAVLKNCPVGTRIKFRQYGCDYETICYKHAPAYQFKTPFWMKDDNTAYCKASQIPLDFEIIEE